MLVAILITVAAAVCGAFIAKKIGIPIPFMIGGMLGVAIFNIFTGMAVLPPNTKTFTQAASGMFIGLSLSRSDLKHLKDLIQPAVILVVCFLMFTTVVGYIMHTVAGFDAATSWLICVPGGVVDISLMAYDLDADPAIVSFIQSFRLFSVYLIFPGLISFVSKHVKETDLVEPLDMSDAGSFESILDKIVPDNRVIRHIVTYAVGLCGAFAGKKLGLPAGALSCSMIIVCIYNMTSHRAMFDRKYKKAVQVIAGGLIGLSMSMDTVRRLPTIVLPAFILIGSYVLVNFLIAWLMTKTRKIDYISAMFAASPGGASEFALIASEIGGESPKIAVLQIVRLLSVYTLFPILVKFMIRIFG